MKAYSTSDSLEQAVFLNRQQCVYLEKSLLKKRESGEPCWLAFIGKIEWRSQRTQFSPVLNCRIDALRHVLEEDFSNRGKLECRFLDVDLLSLLFSHCTEEKAHNYCRRLSQDYYVHFCGSLPSKGAIAPALFDSLFDVESNTTVCGEETMLRIGVTYHQNYLIDVLSHDRDEARNLLLIEAIDQALLAHHALVGEADTKKERYEQ